jgi:hypothetical protein
LQAAYVTGCADWFKRRGFLFIDEPLCEEAVKQLEPPQPACSCGACVDGVLSTRMLRKLWSQAGTWVTAARSARANRPAPLSARRPLRLGLLLIESRPDCGSQPQPMHHWRVRALLVIPQHCKVCSHPA